MSENRPFVPPETLAEEGKPPREEEGSKFDEPPDRRNNIFSGGIKDIDIFQYEL
jgi:hypothetical protein